jgi:hypothetical protein
MLDGCVVKMASCSASYHRCAEKLSLLLNEEKLLRPQNTAWSCDTDPPDELFSRDLIVLHCIEPYQGTSTAETRLTVNGNSAWIGLGEMSLTNV